MLAQLSPEDEERIERILELRRELDALLETLSPELRDEIERRLAEPTGVVSDSPQPDPYPSDLPQADDSPQADSPLPDLPQPDSPQPDSPQPDPLQPDSPQPDPPPSHRVQPEPPKAPPTISTPPAPAMAPPVAPPSPTRRRRECNTLWVIDTDRDGEVGTRDRYWRYLYLWTDDNGNGARDHREVRSVYDAKVRKISTDLGNFEGVKKGFGEIRVDSEAIRLDLGRDGFGGRRNDAVLMLDTTSIRRGEGPEILDTDGKLLDGIQPFAAGWQVRDTSGEVVTLSCP